MTPEQKAAVVTARAAMLNAELAAMNTVNANRERRNEAQAYSEKEFIDLIGSYSDLQRDNLISFMNGLQ